MHLRTIMLFPEFENMDVIKRIRDRYDPLADKVNPHITVAFPFENNMDNKELSDILDKRLQGIKKFEVELQGFSKQEDTFGNYLFLNVTKGSETIITIHNRLYENEWKPFDLGMGFLPHITVGKLPGPQELNQAYEAVKNMDCKFISVINKVSVEMIGDNEESVIVIEKSLGL